MEDLGPRKGSTGFDGIVAGGDRSDSLGESLLEKRPTGATNTQTAFNVLKSFIGAGILALPQAFSNAGWILGPLFMILIAALSIRCMLLIVKCKKAVQARGGTCESYGDLGAYCYGSRGRLVVESALILTQFGFATAYYIFIMENINDVAPGFPKWAILIVATVLLLPFALLRDLKSLSWTSLFADVCIVYGLIIIFYYDAVDCCASGTNAAHISTFPLFFGLAIYTFEGMGMVIDLERSTQNQAAFPSILRNTLSSITVLFIAIGTYTYASYGNELRKSKNSIVTILLPESPSVQLLQVVYSIALFFTYPLMMMPAIRTLESHMRKDVPDAELRRKENMTRMGLYVFSALVAIAIPHFGLFLNLIGSIGCTLIAFMLPTLFHQHLELSETPADTFVDRGTFALGLVGGIIAFVVTCKELASVS